MNETGLSFDGEQNTMAYFRGPQVKKPIPPNKLFVWEAIKKDVYNCIRHRIVHPTVESKQKRENDGDRKI